MKLISQYFNQADSYLEDRNFDKALRLLLKIERISKGKALLSIGNLYDDYAICLGDKYIKKSLQYFKLSAMLGDSNAMLNIGITYKQLNKKRKAIKWLKRSLNNNNLEASLVLAKIYLEKGKIKKAIKHLNNVKNGQSYINISLSSQEDAIKILKNLDAELSSLPRY